MSQSRSRRTFLYRTLAASSLPWVAGSKFASGATWQRPEPDLIVRSTRPLDAETPVEVFDQFLTPNRLFFVRSHFGPPALGLSPWTLEVEGLVNKPLKFSLDDLKGLTTVSLPAVLQCAGNGRGFFAPIIPGVGWGKGAVGNAEWSGVRLVDVLNLAGIKPEAAHVQLMGADTPPNPKTPAFFRSIPLARAIDPNTILATSMNGEPLPLLHGGPIRLVVPTWAGNHWIKWLRKITVAKDEAPGFYMQNGYKMPKVPTPPGVDLKPDQLKSVTTLNVKSLITHPVEGETLKAGHVEIRGVAWTGDGVVEKVEISTGTAGRSPPFTATLDQEPGVSGLINGEPRSDARPSSRERPTPGAKSSPRPRPGTGAATSGTPSTRSPARSVEMTTESEEPGQPAKRPSSRLAVRILMVAVLLLVVGLGWLVQRTQIQSEAVAAITRSGGRVYYDWQKSPNGVLTPGSEPKWPNWMIERLGPDYFGNVVGVTLGRTAGDAEMKLVGQLPELAILRASNAKAITDAGASHLAGLANLEVVQLSRTNITGKALANLRGKPRLRELFLEGLAIGDDDLKNLEGLSQVEILDLTSNQISDAGLTHIEGLIHLKQLRLGSNRVTGPGLVHLQKMDQLARLRLEKCQIRDLSKLPPLLGLLWLFVDDNPIDDASLANLPSFPRLEALQLRRTAITDAGVPRLLMYQGSLKGLALSGPKITDASAPTFVQFENLTTLLLEGSNAITDTTLDQLATLENLRIINLEGTSTTEAGLTRLKSALPELRSMDDLASFGRNRATARIQAVSKAQSKRSAPPRNPGSQP